ncbi:MAG: AraC family transcriptional regulator [Spirochaetales bacterium]|nr:MAG: AraC family transcriptional regulator [Spirochaetales bacterium]
MIENYYCDPPSHWSLAPLYAGQQRCDPGHAWSGVRDHYLLHYITSGSGWVKSGRERKTLGKGEAFLYPPDTFVSYQADHARPWHYIWIGFSGAAARELVSPLGMPGPRPVMTRFVDGRAETLFRDLIDVMKREAPTRISAAAGLLHLILAEMADSAGGHGVSHTQVRLNTAEMMMRARAFIDQNYVREISVADVVRHIGLDRSYLSRCFHHSCGCTVREYLTRLRMERAMELVNGTSLPVSAVGASVGYRNYSTFERCFRRTFGCSPRETRQASRSTR